MVEACQEQQKEGKRVVHVRKRHSSNRDLRDMQAVTSSEKLHLVNLKCKGNKAAGIGEDAESVVTSSELLAQAIERADCRPCSEVEYVVDGEVRKHNCE